MVHLKKETTNYLVYVAIALLFINFILMFLPFIEVYQPSYKKTVLGVTTYEGWYTQSAPMVMFIFPIFLTAIPYLVAIISVVKAFLKKSEKDKFFIIKNNTLDKPIKFLGLKFTSIANAIAMWIAFSQTQSTVNLYDEHGAYLKITFFGVLNILCTVAFIVVIFMLSRKIKNLFMLINKSQVIPNGTNVTGDDSMKENVQ